MGNSRSAIDDTYTHGFPVGWAPRPAAKLRKLVEAAKHAEGNPEWVALKYEECLAEGIQRLQTFPELPDRYIIEGFPCNGFTLWAFPVQVFFRLTRKGVVTIFTCRWARQDTTGPQHHGQA